ncbi:MAG: transcription elongation factor Spt5 [Candidatus Natronoplasma sp.]|nr:transcription elongation factor Spt5 [Candidatus Thermoplasmatota archaeon]MBS3790733.1 transcription elongation factor Spt5 [Candidatus Thermoplasmatota archaeon]
MKTQINQERSVADYIASWAKDKDMGVFSILAPKPVRGYIFIEAMNPSMVDEVSDGTRKAKGIVEGDTSIEEIEHFLAPKLAVEGITEGDIVELSAGPFKGEKARVTQIDEDNDEITVELFEATVPIPVTVRGDHVRVLEKEK